MHIHKFVDPWCKKNVFFTANNYLPSFSIDLIIRNFGTDRKFQIKDQTKILSGYSFIDLYSLFLHLIYDLTGKIS